MREDVYQVMRHIAREQGMPWSTWARIELYHAVVKRMGVSRAREKGIIGDAESYVA